VATLPRMSTHDVRVAGFHELGAVTAYRLWQLRGRVFVVEQACAYLDLDGRDLEPATRHVWVPGVDAPLAYLRLLDDGAVARIGRVVVAEAHRGRGLGDLLMDEAHRLAGERVVVLDAQAHLAGWYRRRGYRAVGPQFLDDGIPHVAMRRDPAGTGADRRV
jgi:ElaA protein